MHNFRHWDDIWGMHDGREGALWHAHEKPQTEDDETATGD